MMPKPIVTELQKSVPGLNKLTRTEKEQLNNLLVSHDKKLLIKK